MPTLNDITENELFQFLIEAQETDMELVSPYRTVAELADASGHPKAWVRIRLHRLESEGRLEIGERVIRNLAGRHQTVPAYRLKNVSGEAGEEEGNS